MPDRRTPASPLYVREVADLAVRSLAVSAEPLHERLRASGAILLERLSQADLPEAEDRELFDRIQLDLLELHLLGHSNNSGAAAAPAPATLFTLATNILDLRDTIMGHAIREARTAATRRIPRASG